QLDQASHDHLTRIRQAAQRMGMLIDDLLKLARVTRAELEVGRTDLSATAASVVGELRRAAPERAVEVSIAPGLSVDGDPMLLGVVLENLLSNAWKFTGKAANPRIEFGRIEQDGEPVYFVRDNGAGFDMAYADKLFGAFQRLHDNKDYPGTGIGLATVQRIIRKHGGRIWAEAAVGRGATFYFTF
ncbi:MAG: ATP-binding protein, partial [Dongiaceae bacterium]